ncbi:MAG: lamin tail domain-containing protein [Bacteriovoracaceae bacterium]|jgi:hypothetical protein|nr:lamin tail domain-containing protein [Bacteriovoracaceae bacterium]
MNKISLPLFLILLSQICLVSCNQAVTESLAENGVDVDSEPQSLLGKVIISEVYPNEPLEDTGWEWIELLNTDLIHWDLSGFKMTDNDGRIYFTFPEGTIVRAGHMLQVGAEKSLASHIQIQGLRLPNDKGVLKLVSPHGELIDRVYWGYSFELLTYSRAEDGVMCRTQPTPKLPNSFCLRE